MHFVEVMFGPGVFSGCWWQWFCGCGFLAKANDTTEEVDQLTINYNISPKEKKKEQEKKTYDVPFLSRNASPFVGSLTGSSALICFCHESESLQTFSHSSALIGALQSLQAGQLQSFFFFFFVVY